jgi:hypothetical protein
MPFGHDEDMKITITLILSHQGRGILCSLPLVGGMKGRGYKLVT